MMIDREKWMDRFHRLDPVRTVWVSSALLLVMFVFWNFEALFHRPHVTERRILLHVSPGSTFRTVVFDLNRLGITHFPETLIFWGDLLGIDTNILAGVYEIAPEMSPFRVLVDLHNGQKFFYRVTIPEGFTLKQVAQRMAALGIGTEPDILNLAHDPQFLMALNVPSPSLEGYLFPDTYYFPKIAKPEDVLKIMVERFWSVLTSDQKAAIEKEHFTVQEAVTLASIVQKETGNPKDMPVVAGVFINRLKQHMKLQSDPTVIYALDGRKTLHAKDLTVDSPYNTYRYPGLPPTPISNPGEMALKSVFYPKDVPYLYFVSNGHGGQIFSETLEEQDHAIRMVLRNRSGK